MSTFKPTVSRAAAAAYTCAIVGSAAIWLGVCVIAGRAL